MDRRRKYRPKRGGHDNYEMILMSLSDGAKTLDEIRENFFAFARRLGVFAPLYQHAPADYDMFSNQLAQDMDKLISLGWVGYLDGKYILSETGAQLANERLTELHKAATLFEKLLQPENVSKAAVAVHFALTAIKLPAAILSGSIGLFNDSADTVLDGLSSLMVYFGLRFNKERLANMILVGLMLLTGSFGFYEAVKRFFIPQEPAVSWFTFFSSALSGLVCIGLGFYQRYIGLKSGSMALITQSIDSRNHVIVAASVISGLIASRLQFTLIDTIVGVCIGALILKSGIELAIELIRSRSSERPDFSRYELGISKRYEEFKQDQLRDWLLYLVHSHKANDRIELLKEASQALDFDQYPALKAFGLGNQGQSPEMIAQVLNELFEHGLLIETESLEVTPSGKAHLSSLAHKAHRMMGRSFIEEEAIKV
jgi:Co/Zn/Cd efflux system component